MSSSSEGVILDRGVGCGSSFSERSPSGRGNVGLGGGRRSGSKNVVLLGLSERGGDSIALVVTGGGRAMSDAERSGADRYPPRCWYKEGLRSREVGLNKESWLRGLA
jgi:hypothetical protein